jgi:hypothetical protein
MSRDLYSIDTFLACLEVSLNGLERCWWYYITVGSLEHAHTYILVSLGLGILQNCDVYVRLGVQTRVSEARYLAEPVPSSKPRAILDPASR